MCNQDERTINCTLVVCLMSTNFILRSINNGITYFPQIPPVIRVYMSAVSVTQTPPSTTLLVAPQDPSATATTTTTTIVPSSQQQSSGGGAIAIVVLLIIGIIILVVIIWWWNQHRRQVELAAAAAAATTTTCVAKNQGYVPSTAPTVVSMSAIQPPSTPPPCAWNQQSFPVVVATPRQSSSVGGIAVPPATGNGTPEVVFETLPIRSQQCFVVTGINECGESAASPVQCITLDCPPPGAPTNLSSSAQVEPATVSTPGLLNVTLRWDAPGALRTALRITTYVPDQRTGAINIADTAFGSRPSPFIFGTSAPILGFRVTANNECGQTEASTGTLPAPVAPTNLIGRGTDQPTAIQLSWNTVPDAVGYWVAVRRQSTTNAIDTYIVNTNQITVARAAAIDFTVASIGANGAASALAPFAPACSVPEQPATVTTQQASNTSARVAWTPAPRALSYRVYRGTDQSVSPRNYQSVQCYPPGTPCPSGPSSAFFL